MSHTGLPVHGYVDQAQSNIDLVNANKVAEERVLRLLDSLKPSADPRWLALARTHIEQGFMAANRAIFQPTRINLPEDK